MQSREQLIRQLSARYGVDPNAVVAIASVEGPSALHGGVSIGDHGTSGGPFQLHVGGALPRGKSLAWANTPAGIEYAIRKIASVAGGLTGKAAVSAISSRFERPADVPGEIQKAMGYYGKGGSGGGMPGAPTQNPALAAGTAAGPDFRKAFAGFLLQASQNTLKGGAPDFGGLVALAQMRQQLQSAQSTFGPASRASSSSAAPAPGGKISWEGASLQGENGAFLSKVAAAASAAGATKIRSTSGYRDPQHNASVGGVGHSDHTFGHALDGEAFVPGKGWIPLGTLLKGDAGHFGLRSGDQAGFYRGGPDTVHVDDNYYFRTH